jgi:multimeric flavodoxin WrbA
MKILAICGSPRGKKSQTKLLTEKLLEGAAAADAAVELVDLGRLRIGFCQACETCHQGPDCMLTDDGRAILAKVLEADGLVLASPVYLSQVTAQMKALLDRTSHFVHCLRLMGKYVAAVTTSGGGGGAEVHEWLRKYSFTVGAQYVGGVDARVPLKDSDYADAVTLGKALVSAIQEKKAYPDQLQIIDAQKKRFGQLIALRKNQWPYEHEYWRRKSWL